MYLQEVDKHDNVLDINRIEDLKEFTTEAAANDYVDQIVVTMSNEEQRF